MTTPSLASYDYQSPVIAGSPDTLITTNPTISTSAYSSGYVVGGIQTLTAAVRSAGGNALLESISIIDKAAQAAALSIFFFSAAPSGGTYADHGAVTSSAGDAPNMLGKVDISTYDTFGTYSVATVSGIALCLLGDKYRNIYAVATTTSTPTYTAQALFFKYGILEA